MPINDAKLFPSKTRTMIPHNETPTTNSSLPPIDLAVPESLQMATFALG
jgi:hypothetical protein